jgi:heptosyltransferase-3
LPCRACKVSLTVGRKQLFKLFLLTCMPRREHIRLSGKYIKMNLERFLQLWTHRYHKYSHILLAHFKGYISWLHFRVKKSSLSKNQQLIAIVRTEHFGDIVAAEPISRYVRSQFPDAYIVWFVKPAYHELVDFNPSINETHHEFCVTERKVLLRTGVFDQVFELQFRNNNHCAKCQVFTENPIAVQRGIDVYNYFNFGNLLEVFAQTGGLINANTPFAADDQPRLFLQESHRHKVDGLGLNKPFIVVHCQSNYAPKDWPQYRWAMLIDWLAEHYDYDIVEIGLKSSVTLKTAYYKNLCGQLSILETAEVIRRASYFIGLDSGPSHLANATGTFGIILMGSLNDFPSYNPYSGSFGRQENAVFVRKAGVPCAELSIEFVKEAVSHALKK